MRVKRNGSRKPRPNKPLENHTGSMRGLGFLVLCTFCAVVLIFGTKVGKSGQDNQVYAASDKKDSQDISSVNQTDHESLPTGIAGVVSGLEETYVPGSTVYRIGSSCEQVMVGQRVQTVGSSAGSMNVSTSMENMVNSLDSKATSLAMTPKIMSDGDYDTLLRIVEAEAGGEDIKGRVLVANVIMNRVKNDQFPDTVTDVVWEYDNGVPQFSPTYDGRINEVTVSDDTKEAVKQALNGVDYSEGALFFVQKSAAEKHSVVWFDEELEWLFRHGVHDFYKYPDDDSIKKDSEEKTDEELVQMESEEN